MRPRRRQTAFAPLALPLVTLAPLAALSLVAACGGSGASITQLDAAPDTSTTTATGPGSGGPDAATESDAASMDAGVIDGSTDARAPNDPGCPVTFDAPTGHCQAGLTCHYEEGTCACQNSCNGVMPIEPPFDSTRWTCTPKRTDGCPEQPPASGAACEKKQQSCSYRVNCCSVLYSCTNGRWTPDAMACPL